MVVKKIIFDFEFLSSNYVEGELIEGCFLFVEDNKVINEIFSKIKIEFSFEELNKKYSDALKFNKILSQKDIENHNKGAISLDDFIKELFEKLSTFTLDQIPLTGWICAGSDIPILKNTFSKKGIEFSSIFDYHTRDIGIVFQSIYEKKFKGKFDLHLSDAHCYLFGTISKEEFHNSKIDCLATLDMDKWIEKEFEKLK